MDSKTKIPLVLQSEVGEIRWLEFLLSDLDLAWMPAQDYNPGSAPVAIHALSTNSPDLDEIVARIEADKKSGTQVGLIHLSDEWFRADTRFYRGAAFVLKFYFCSFLQNPAIKYVPLGPPSHLEIRPATKPASERRFVWFFTGQRKYSRNEMLAAFQDTGPHFLPGRFITDAEYHDALYDAAFVPCPMGNTTPDTWRLYEALEAGCIPIVERRWTIDYFGRLFGSDCPIPRFHSWAAAARWIAEVRERGDLDEWQRKIRDWWIKTKAALPVEMGAFVRSRLETGDAFALKNWAPPYAGWMLRLRWMIEVSRYATPAVLWERGVKRFRREPPKIAGSAKR